jgi:hypothetical protein
MRSRPAWAVEREKKKPWVFALLAETGTVMLKASLGQKLARPPSQSVSWSWWFMPMIPAMWRHG